MQGTEKVLAICVNWNGEEVLRETLDSLLSSNYPHLQVCVVDNASTDQSLEVLKPLERDIDIVKLEENRGYGGGANTPVRRDLEKENDEVDRRSFFLICNNDLIFHHDAVSALVEAARRRPPGIFGPKVVRHSRPQQMEAISGRITWSHLAARFEGEGNSAESVAGAPHAVQLLLGSALLIDRELFQRVGLFDESFFMYHEEVDLLYRAQKAGFPVFLCPSATVEHRDGHSTRGKPELKTYWTRRGSAIFMRKHAWKARQWLWFGLTLSGSLLFNLMTGRTRRLKAIWQGVWDGLAADRPNRFREDHGH